jgi:hypothetical protein
LVRVELKHKAPRMQREPSGGNLATASTILVEKFAKRCLHSREFGTCGSFCEKILCPSLTAFLVYFDLNVQSKRNKKREKDWKKKKLKNRGKEEERRRKKKKKKKKKKRQ